MSGTKIEQTDQDRREREGWGDDWDTRESGLRRARAVYKKITARQLRDGTADRIDDLLRTKEGRKLLERWNRERAEIGLPPLEARR